MGSGNAIRGSRVGAGPMGRRSAARRPPVSGVPFWCANMHETRPSFASDAAGPGILGLPPVWPPCRSGRGEPARAAAQRAVQDAPRLCEGAP